MLGLHGVCGDLAAFWGCFFSFLGISGVGSVSLPFFATFLYVPGFLSFFGDFLPKNGHTHRHTQTHTDTHTDRSAFCACPMRHGAALRDCGAEAGRAGSWPAVFGGLRAPAGGRALNRSPAESYWVERPK